MTAQAHAEESRAAESGGWFARSPDEVAASLGVDPAAGLAAAAIEREDSMTAGMVAEVLETGRREGFLNTIVSTAPQVTSWLVAHATRMRQDPFLEKLICAALEARATQPDGTRPRPAFTTSLTAAELRILRLLPTSTYLQIAATLYISRNTVKSELRSIYQKLGASSRAEAIERAVELRLL